ncbi:MAG: DNA-protecting protein DprA [Candidatus Omnitrophica bacterium]|nr:DNA-protecting protein DprA [Candidatus Omnitrophota bacterium]
MTDQEAIVLLSALPGLGSVKVRKLVEHFGSVANALKAKEKDFAALGLFSRNSLQKIFEFDRDNFLQSEYNLIRQNDVAVVTIFDEEYPIALRSIYDPPIVLYVRGKIPKDEGLSVAVVGSRNASVYGLTVAEKLSSQLAELGLTVVSGLAKGIDAAAHRGCLRTGGHTIAVVGCGLSHIYPPEHKELFAEISIKGAVISSLPMATPPIAFNFPARNRIISGMSLAVLVVEASLKSGALITSHFALEQGRDVFAVPGKIDHPNSQGVNRLIKDGAKLVTCFEDILEELDPQLRRISAAPRKLLPTSNEKVLKAIYSEDELSVAQWLSQEPLYIDDLISKSGQPHGDVVSTLLKMELKGIVKKLPGQYFVLA